MKGGGDGDRGWGGKVGEVRHRYQYSYLSVAEIQVEYTGWSHTLRVFLLHELEYIAKTSVKRTLEQYTSYTAVFSVAERGCQTAKRLVIRHAVGHAFDTKSDSGWDCSRHRRGRRTIIVSEICSSKTSLLLLSFSLAALVGCAVSCLPGCC